MRNTAYETITQKVIEQLEAGTVPWRRPWKGGPCHAPRNLSSGKAYRGINVLILMTAGYNSPFWVTYKQAKDLGGYVKKGERGTGIVFWRFVERENEGEETERYAVCRLYTVFNVEQCEGLDALIPTKFLAPRPTFLAIEAAQKIVDGWIGRPEIRHGGDRACYSTLTDTVTVPAKERFESSEAYYATVFHELTHSTGHAKRLARGELTTIAAFGDHNYSREELVAELGAAFLCGEAGIEASTLTNSASYIAGWLKSLRNDKRMVLVAAGKAQAAADMILGRDSSAEKDDQQ